MGAQAAVSRSGPFPIETTAPARQHDVNGTFQAGYTAFREAVSRLERANGSISQELISAIRSTGIYLYREYQAHQQHVANLPIDSEVQGIRAGRAQIFSNFSKLKTAMAGITISVTLTQPIEFDGNEVALNELRASLRLMCGCDGFEPSQFAQEAVSCVESTIAHSIDMYTNIARFSNSSIATFSQERACEARNAMLRDLDSYTLGMEKQLSPDFDTFVSPQKPKQHRVRSVFRTTSTEQRAEVQETAAIASTAPETGTTGEQAARAAKDRQRNSSQKGRPPLTDAMLKEALETMPVKKVAERFGRTLAAIYIRRKKLGLDKVVARKEKEPEPERTIEKQKAEVAAESRHQLQQHAAAGSGKLAGRENELAEAFKTMSGPEAARHLGVTDSAIHRKWKKMGLDVRSKAHPVSHVPGRELPKRPIGRPSVRIPMGETIRAMQEGRVPELASRYHIQRETIYRHLGGAGAIVSGLKQTTRYLEELDRRIEKGSKELMWLKRERDTVVNELRAAESKVHDLLRGRSNKTNRAE